MALKHVCKFFATSHLEKCGLRPLPWIWNILSDLLVTNRIHQGHILTSKASSEMPTLGALSCHVRWLRSCPIVLVKKKKTRHSGESAHWCSADSPNWGSSYQQPVSKDSSSQSLPNWGPWRYAIFISLWTYEHNLMVLFFLLLNLTLG